MDEAQFNKIDSAVAKLVAAAKKTGLKIELSQMEIVFLATVAQIGLYSVFGNDSTADAETRAESEKLRGEILEFIDRNFKTGLASFLAATAGVLVELRGYIMEPPQHHGAGIDS